MALTVGDVGDVGDVGGRVVDVTGVKEPLVIAGAVIAVSLAVAVVVHLAARRCQVALFHRSFDYSLSVSVESTIFSLDF